jgi:hypothetical protein
VRETNSLIEKPPKMLLMGLQNRIRSGCKEKGFDFWHTESRTLFTTEALKSVFSKLKQHRLSLTTLWKKEAGEDELWTEKDGGFL